MLTANEQTQLKELCEKDSSLSALIQKLDTSYRLNLSRISHEIRNPVTVMNSFLQLMQNKHPEVKEYNSWAPIMENMHYLRQLLEEISDYNHSQFLHKKHCSLKHLLESIVTSCQLSILPVQIQFQKLSPVPSASFDEIQIRSAILNLIRNAREALGDDPHGEILVSLNFDGNFFYISVSNNGPEIPGEHLETLFHPFVTYKKNGSGLGLSIVQNVAAAHGGEIFVSSDISETKFTMKLPLLFEED